MVDKRLVCVLRGRALAWDDGVRLPPTRVHFDVTITRLPAVVLLEDRLGRSAASGLRSLVRREWIPGRCHISA